LSFVYHQAAGNSEGDVMQMCPKIKAAYDCVGTFNADTENLLSRLRVQVESFRVDDTRNGASPSLPTANQLTVLYVVKGEGSLVWPSGETAIGQGVIAVIPGMLPTFLREKGDRIAANDAVLLSSTNNLVVASSVVSASAGHGLGYFENIAHPLVENPNDALLGQIFSGILTEMAAPGIGSKSLVESLMKHVLIILLRRIITHQKIATPLYQTIANPALALVINAIQNGYAERLSVASLARIAGMTPFALTSQFERVFGESLLDYIQGVRLHQATNLLTQTELPVKSIAALVGFASRSHFSRMFTKRQGQDPTSFRRTKELAALALSGF
jgi:AraC family transcriptional regulator, activator of mtrCDE